MGPFLTVRRQALVDLPAPWDPSRVIQDYLADPSVSQEFQLSDDQRATLARDGLLIRIDAKHRWMGAMAGEMRLAVLNPLTVAVEIDGWATVRWWLRPFVLPFRPRLRRAVSARIDQLLEELETDVGAVTSELDDDDSTAQLLEADEERASTPQRPGVRNRVRWTVQVLTTAGQPVYEHTEGS